MSIYERVNNYGETKRVNEPHPDCETNFSEWNFVFNGKSFQRTLEKLQCKVIEFYRFHDQEKFYCRFVSSFVDRMGNKIPPRIDEGVPHPHIPGQKVIPDFVNSGTPICVQVSFKNKKGNHCVNLNFQQSNQDFRIDCSHFLKIDWSKNDPKAWK